jgi:hypothetical protein
MTPARLCRSTLLLALIGLYLPAMATPDHTCSRNSLCTAPAQESVRRVARPGAAHANRLASPRNGDCCGERPPGRVPSVVLVSDEKGTWQP